MNWKTITAVAWSLVIIALCSIPGPSLPGPDLAGADKLAHFVLFAVFAWLWLGASSRRPRTAVRNVLIAGLLLAGLTEVYQGVLPFDRDPSLMDALANTAGLLVGIGIYRILRRRTDR